MTRFFLAIAAFTAIAACANQPQHPYHDSVPNISDAPEFSVPTGAPWRDEGIGARHSPSGILCPQRVGEFALVELTDHGTDILPLDVACGYASALGDYTALHITKFDRRVSEQRYLDVSVAAIETTTPLERPAPLPARSDGVPLAPVGTAFRTGLTAQAKTDEPVDTAVWVDEIGGWHIKVRATYAPSSAPIIADVVSELFYAAKKALPGGTL